MESKSLLAVYADPTDLGYQVREALEHDLTQMDLGVDPLPVAAPPAHAMPRLRYDEQNKRLVAENVSDGVRAEQFVLEVEGADDQYGQAGFSLDYDGEPVDLLPRSSAQWPLILFWQSPRQTNITMRWVENGEPQQERQIVYLY